MAFFYFVLGIAGDGVYSYRLDDGSIELMDVNTNTSRYLVKGTSIKDVRLSSPFSPRLHPHITDY